MDMKRPGRLSLRRAALQAWAQGVAATEFAITLPLTLALVILTLALAVRAIDQLSAASLAPQDIRDRAVLNGQPGNHLSNLVGVNTPYANDSLNCSGRVQFMSMNQGLLRDWPVLRWLDGTVLMGALSSNLQAATSSYTWGFHPGYEGECQ
jgi:hypothetical protein